MADKDTGATIKFLYGQRDGIESKIQAGTIDGSDLIITSDTDELVFVDKTKAVKPIKSRTVEEHTLVGTGIGALADGSVLPSGIDLDEFIEMISKKSLPVEYTEPTVDIHVTSGDEPGAYEVGERVAATFQGTFTKNDAGSVSSFEILKDGEPVDRSALSSVTAAANFQVEEGPNLFTARVTYGEGPVKDDNMGNPSSEGHIHAGTIESDAIEYVGKRGVFFGCGSEEPVDISSSSTRALGGIVLAPEKGVPVDIPLEAGQRWVRFAYPAALSDAPEVMYVETGDTKMAPCFEVENAWVEGANSAAGADYKVYTYIMAAPARTGMTFRVTF